MARWRFVGGASSRLAAFSKITYLTSLLANAGERRRDNERISDLTSIEEGLDLCVVGVGLLGGKVLVQSKCQGR